jgi:hypothetical protein
VITLTEGAVKSVLERSQGGDINVATTQKRQSSLQVRIVQYASTQTAPHVLKELGPSNRVLLESEQPSGSRRDPAETDASTLHDMATGPQINVYASPPWTVESGGNLDINPSAWKWAHRLTLPLHTL